MERAVRGAVEGQPTDRERAVKGQSKGSQRAVDKQWADTERQCLTARPVAAAVRHFHRHVICAVGYTAVSNG